MSRRKHHRRSGASLHARSAALRHVGWIPAAVGLAVSLYLLGLDVLGVPAFCLTPSGCDIVRSSSYGRIAGIPVPVIGVVFFSIALGLCLTRRPWRGVWLESLASVGVGGAIVFIGLQLAVLHEVCPYCLVAEAAACVLAYLVFRDGPRTAWIRAAGLTIVTAVALSLIYAWTPPPAARTYAADLARHLAQNGAVIYGAYWCPHCQEQKALFGPAASLLPYVECDPRAVGAQPERCRARGIRGYPTWEIHGALVEGVLPLDELARRSGFTPPRPAP